MAPSRSRSPSPRRSNKSSQRNGFRWKDKPKQDEEPESNRGLERNCRLERGDDYRRHDDNRDRNWGGGRNQQRVDDDMPRDRDRNESDRDGKDKTRWRSREQRRTRSRERVSKPTIPLDAAIASKFGPSSTSLTTHPNASPIKPTTSTTAAAQSPSPAPLSNEPMILVTINDRLGTKAQIPCLASDPVRLFKAQVAARIGRQPHEIMLKRQGERPFKDQLTLEDYGVSSGVQLDLEVDTGD